MQSLSHGRDTSCHDCDSKLRETGEQPLDPRPSSIGSQQMLNDQDTVPLLSERQRLSSRVYPCNPSRSINPYQSKSGLFILEVDVADLVYALQMCQTTSNTKLTPKAAHRLATLNRLEKQTWLILAGFHLLASVLAWFRDDLSDCAFYNARLHESRYPCKPTAPG